MLAFELDQSAQDSILREDLQQTRVSPDELYPPALEHLHQQLQQLRLADQSASEGSSLTEAFAISMYLREAFQHARVNGAHILESVMKAALSSIKGGQLQRVADVMAPYPRLKPLVAVMGWDLLAGQTKERRQLMELLWIRRHTTEGHMHAVSTEEVDFLGAWTCLSP
jgi:zinc finger FYVE domain-containing protein 26